MPTVLSPDDPRRPDKVRRYKPLQQTDSTNISEHVNALGMVFSLVGLLLKVSRSCVHVVSFWKFCFADEVGSMGGRILYTNLRSKWQGRGRQETDNQFIYVSYSIKSDHVVLVPTQNVCGYISHVLHIVLLWCRLAMSSLVMVYMQNPSPIFSAHG